jgi:hypothetical protein
MGKTLQFRSLEGISFVFNVVNLERERKTKNIEDCERPVLNLKADMFKFLYAWMAT